jgi:hypothetical protein
LVDRYLGANRRPERGVGRPRRGNYVDLLARTRFGQARRVFAPGRPDVVRDIDNVVDGVLSMSSSAPHLFGDRLEAFEDDARSLLRAHSPSGLFWQWSGDTQIVVANKPV